MGDGGWLTLAASAAWLPLISRVDHRRHVPSRCAAKCRHPRRVRVPESKLVRSEFYTTTTRDVTPTSIATAGIVRRDSGLVLDNVRGPFLSNMSHASIPPYPCSLIRTRSRCSVYRLCAPENREITVIICIIPSDFLYSASYEQLHVTDGGGLISLLITPAFLAQARMKPKATVINAI